MGREHRIIHALQHSGVPVAPALGYCDDDTVNDAPFYVMGFVDGHVIRDRASAEAILSPAARRHAGESIVDTMAAIHAVDLDAVGLADLSKHEGYIARQLKRWYGQWNAQKTRDLTAVDTVHDELLRRIPEQGPATIVHGDYRLDNCMLGDDGSIVAVLDWEICTLGDPLADLGLLYVYWSDPDEGAVLPQASPTALEGFPRKDELVARYAEVSGRDVSSLGFYVAFGYWKLTCIIAGVYARYAGGAMGDVPAEQVTGFRYMLDKLAELTEQAVADAGLTTGTD
jgi:aminoglycoside phosphotransferase (APT) family kinase protein